MTKHQVDKSIKLHILDLKKRGYKRSEIAEIYQISIGTITNITNKSKKENKLERKSRIDKNKKYNIDEIIKSLLLNNNGLTVNQIVAILQKDNNIKCSRMTVYGRIKKLEFNSKKPILKPLLTEQHLNYREYWAIFYENFDWNTVIWSDESTISIQPNNYSKVWIHKDTKFIKRIVKYPLKLHVWGCILKNHKLVIHIYDKTMTGDKYVEIIKLKLIPSINDKKKLENTKFLSQ